MKHIGTFEYQEEAARAYDAEARRMRHRESCLNFPTGGTLRSREMCSRGKSYTIMELFRSEGQEVPSDLEPRGRKLLAIVEQLDESGAVPEALQQTGVPVHLYTVRSTVFCCSTTHSL
jgi:hypothetical protein